MKKILIILRQDPVLFASLLLASISAFLTPPSGAYFSYIDYRVLSLLFSLMLAVAGLRQAGVFAFLAEKLLRYIKSTRLLSLLLVLLCFFTSMLITNDVALIAFVPFAILLLREIRKERLYVPVIVLMTVAANLGSMFTPLGNPQNLYLYTLSGMGISDFLFLMAKPTFLSLMLLIGTCFCIRTEPISPYAEKTPFARRDALVFLFLFILSLLAVFRFVHYGLSLSITVLAVFFYRRKLLAEADYALLLTFVFFFIFVGNIKEIPAVSSFFASFMQGHTLSVAILSSQVISNVPAAMLLSGFTDNFSALLLGVNLGGLGTLIASMASVISYKQYAATPDAKKGKYLLAFTLVNILFLLILWIFVGR
ncbi:MAG: citrate transporter [Ruminococcaceae bacterium]|nr:citrate transporter [Oscillospiraceae bacterium]